jgi:hypothetical protein
MDRSLWCLRIKPRKTFCSSGQRESGWLVEEDMPSPPQRTRRI